MKLLKSTLSMALLMAAGVTINAQVKRTSVVEHFTNTSCSVCAANNNSIHNSINSVSGTLHISIHPSSPYTSDVFNQQNKAENDNRTHFYGIFGSTPRVVVNGTSISYSNLKAALIEQSSSNTNFSIKIYHIKINSDSFLSRTVIHKLANDTISKALLFLGVTEDTILQTTNNGETKHYNVFRKALTQVIGNSIYLPLGIGDSIVTTIGYKSAEIWDNNRLNIIGILQQNNKTLINSAKSINQNGGTASITNFGLKSKTQIVSPNPFLHFIEITDGVSEISIYNHLGKLVYTQTTDNSSKINLSQLPAGIYFIKVRHDNIWLTQKIVKQ